MPPSGSMRSGALSARRRSALPTPAAASSSSPLLKTPPAQLAINGGSQHPEKRKAGGHGPTLADEVEHLLPTPRASDGEKGGPNQRGSKGDLALPAVAHRIGAGSAPPSPAGNTPPDDEPHGQLTLAIG
ncbi:hypothetical protein CWI85_28460 [Streptomyces albidoflavus]|nr:hypothetical protein CWI85_28460 [Streptomyces albidoflavus]